MVERDATTRRVWPADCLPACLRQFPEDQMLVATPHAELMARQQLRRSLFEREAD